MDTLWRLFSKLAPTIVHKKTFDRKERAVMTIRVLVLAFIRIITVHVIVYKFWMMWFLYKINLHGCYLLKQWWLRNISVVNGNYLQWKLSVTMFYMPINIFIFFLYFSKQFVCVYLCFAEQAKLSKTVQSRFLFL
jgi:hypothetical protein